MFDIVKKLFVLPLKQQRRIVSNERTTIKGSCRFQK